MRNGRRGRCSASSTTGPRRGWPRARRPRGGGAESNNRGDASAYPPLGIHDSGAVSHAGGSSRTARVLTDGRRRVPFRAAFGRVHLVRHPPHGGAWRRSRDILTYTPPPRPPARAWWPKISRASVRGGCRHRWGERAGGGCGCAAREIAATAQSLEARLSGDPGRRHRAPGDAAMSDYNLAERSAVLNSVTMLVAY